MATRYFGDNQIMTLSEMESTSAVGALMVEYDEDAYWPHIVVFLYKVKNRSAII